jgi:hypothetical protein
MRAIRFAGALALAAVPALAQYAVHREGDVVRLEDTATQTVVSIMPARGNMAFDMRVKGKKVLVNHLRQRHLDSPRRRLPDELTAPPRGRRCRWW